MKTQGHVKQISSVDTNNSSILELNILPGEKTPWHYHTLFSDIFEVLKGTWEVGKGNDIYYLKQGELATIELNKKHYYHHNKYHGTIKNLHAC